jgi:rhodanese-related sulfurtransferase
LNRSGREALVLVGAALVIGFGVNAVRDEPLPMTGSLDPPPPRELGADLSAQSTGEALRQWEEGVFFLDVRSRDAYEARRIAGAFWLEAEQFADRYFDVVAGFGAEIPLFVYGAGSDSFAVRRVAAELLDLGHEVGLAVCGLEELIAAGVDAEDGPSEGMP